MHGAAKDGDGVAVRVEVAGEDLTYLSGAAGDDDLHGGRSLSDLFGIYFADAGWFGR